MTKTTIEALPGKWRGLANDALRRSGTWNGNDIADRIEFMADELEAALAALSQGEGQPEANEWKDAVLDELAISCMDFSIGTPPREIIKALIDLHVQIATDHRVNGGLSLQPHTPHPEAQQPESRAITALKVTLFGVECYLPSSVAQAVEEACTREAQQPEAVAWRVWIDSEDSCFKPYWTEWSTDVAFKEICKKDGHCRIEYAYPGTTPTHDGGVGSEVVGHKTFSDGRGGFRHEPLTRAEADALIAHCNSEDERRKALMPDEQSAIRMMMDAYIRLKEMGWNDAIYCPKDGRAFEVIEPGSTGIFKCVYQGEWPEGTWWIVEDGDMSPSRPVLFRPLTAAQQQEPKEKE